VSGRGPARVPAYTIVPDRPLQPDYARKFRCIGPDCEENCCGGWGIYVDKATYKRYRGTPSLREAAKEFIQINPAARDNFQFATVKVKSDRRCPFLSTGNLCTIQQQHGHDFLPKACQQYPRVLSRLGGKMQKALFLSCPEAARLVLLDSRLLPAREGPRYGWASCLDDQNRPGLGPEEVMQHLQTIALDLLQDRSYPLWQRLFLLGTICRRVLEFPAKLAPWKVPQLLSQYATIISEGQLRPQLDGIPSRPEPQLGLIVQLLQRRFQLAEPEEGFASRVAHFLQIVGSGEGSSQTDSAERYCQASLRYGLPFEQDFPFFLENYLVNYIFQTGFPFASGVDMVVRSKDPLTSFLAMALHYRLLRGLLIGEAAWRGGTITSAQAIQVVYIFARAVEHSASFFNEVLRFAKLPELQTSDGMAMILRS
jgi:lysine-N-methylase